jgi:hypothetical protein
MASGQKVRKILDIPGMVSPEGKTLGSKWHHGIAIAFRQIVFIT